MSLHFWSTLNILAGYFSFALLFLVTGLSAHLEIKDLDLWLHLRTGQWILQNQQLPTHDIYSAVLAARPWNNHEWLFQVVLAKVHAWGDFNGLIIMQVVVVMTTLLALMLFLYRRHQQLLMAIVLYGVLQIYQTRLTIRPDIFSLLFLVMFIGMLYKGIRHRWQIALLGIIQLAWVNMHGFFFMGPLCVLIFLVGSYLNDAFRWSNTESKKNLWILLGVLPLLCLFNPQGITGAIYPLGILFHIQHDADIFFKHIVELARPITADNIWTAENIEYKIMLILSFYSFIFNRQRLDMRVILIWLFFILFSLAAVRNLIFFGVVGAWVILINAEHLTMERLLPIRFISEKFKFISAIFLKVLFIYCCLQHMMQFSRMGYFDFDNLVRKTELEGVSKRNFPYKAVDFILKTGIRGNIFNDFNSGAYLIGRASDRIKVFIDGRTELYGADFFKTYQRIWRKGDKALFLRFAKEHNITAAFLNANQQDIATKTIKMFYHLKDWRLVYFAHDGMILLKKTPQNQSIIDQYHVDLKKWQVPKLNMYEAGPKRITPFPFLSRATMLYQLGFYQQAIAELNESLLIAPDYVGAYDLLARIYLIQNDTQRAFKNARIAVMYAPKDEHCRFSLAVSYERLNLLDKALQQYERLLSDFPESKRSLRGALRCRIKLIDEMFINKDYKRALMKLKDMTRYRLYQDAIWYRIGLTYAKLGDTIRAKEALAKGLAINPKHPGLNKAMKIYEGVR